MSCLSPTLCGSLASTFGSYSTSRSSLLLDLTIGLVLDFLYPANFYSGAAIPTSAFFEFGLLIGINVWPLPID